MEIWIALQWGHTSAPVLMDCYWRSTSYWRLRITPQRTLPVYPLPQVGHSKHGCHHMKHLHQQMYMYKFFIAQLRSVKIVHIKVEFSKACAWLQKTFNNKTHDDNGKMNMYNHPTSPPSPSNCSVDKSFFKNIYNPTHPHSIEFHDLKIKKKRSTV